MLRAMVSAPEAETSSTYASLWTDTSHLHGGAERGEVLTDGVIGLFNPTGEILRKAELLPPGHSLADSVRLGARPAGDSSGWGEAASPRAQGVCSPSQAPLEGPRGNGASCGRAAPAIIRTLSGTESSAGERSCHWTACRTAARNWSRSASATGFTIGSCDTESDTGIRKPAPVTWNQVTPVPTWQVLTPDPVGMLKFTVPLHRLPPVRTELRKPRSDTPESPPGTVTF